MFTTTKIYTRPNTDVTWHTEILPNMPSDILENFLAVENDFKGKKSREVDSSKPLELTVTVTWESQADYTDYWNKSEVNAYFSKVNSYYTANGGSVSPRVTS